MPLRIQQIEYDHAAESRTYETGVLSVDSTSKQIHVHNGIIPNGIAVPSMEDIEGCANTGLTNVSQENITALLARYGALSMNDSASISKQQLDNVYSKLKFDGLQSDKTLPADNLLSVNSTTRKVNALDSALLPFYHGADFKGGGINRAQSVTYTADRDCYVLVHGINGCQFYIDDVRVLYIWPSVSFTSFEYANMFPVGKGQTYMATSNQGFRIYAEYGARRVYQQTENEES